MKNYTALLLVILISVHAMPVNNSILTKQTAHEVNSKATGEVHADVDEDLRGRKRMPSRLKSTPISWRLTVEIVKRAGASELGVLEMA